MAAGRGTRLGFCAALLVAGASARPDRWSDLLAGLRAGQEPPLAALVEELGRRGSPGVEEWLAAVEGAPEHARPSLLAQGGDALGELGELRAAATQDAERRALALAGLALARELAGGADLAPVIDLGRVPAEADAGEWRGVRRELEAALCSILVRHPEALGAAAALYVGEEWPEALIVARAISASDDGRAFEHLQQLLGVHQENDGSLLGEIGNLAERRAPLLSAGGSSRVRAYLGSSDAYCRRQAAYALGRLEDYDSVALLVERLQDEDGGVRRVSHWALQRITRMTIGQDPPRWSTWFREESEWWEERSQEILDKLRFADAPAELVPVIRECGARRLFRPQLVPELVPLLGHQDPGVVRMTCSALLSLRARESLADLVPLLERPEPEVRTLAWNVLVELSGENLPSEREAWDRVLAGMASPK